MNNPRKGPRPKGAGRRSCLGAAVIAAWLLAPVPGAAAETAPKVVYKVPTAARPLAEDQKNLSGRVLGPFAEAKPAARPVEAAPGSGDRDEGAGDRAPGGPPRPVYVYDPAGRTDPFRPFIAEQEEVDQTAEREPRTYLETLELSQLDLIAIIETAGGNWAMVRDKKGIGYTVRKGTPIGVHGGVVEAIGEKEMVIRETHRDYKGKKTVKTVRKALLPTQ